MLTEAGEDQADEGSLTQPNAVPGLMERSRKRGGRKDRRAGRTEGQTRKGEGEEGRRSGRSRKAELEEEEEEDARNPPTSDRDRRGRERERERHSQGWTFFTCQHAKQKVSFVVTLPLLVVPFLTQNPLTFSFIISYITPTRKYSPMPSASSIGLNRRETKTNGSRERRGGEDEGGGEEAATTTN